MNWIERAFVLAMIWLILAFAFIVVYYIGAYNTVNDMEILLSGLGEDVVIEFNGFVYPEFFDTMFGGK